MKPGDFYRRKKIVIFSLIFLVTVAIEFFLIVSLWKKDDTGAVALYEKTKQPETSVGYNMLLAQNGALGNRLKALQQLDEQYAALLTDSGYKVKLDSVNQKIHIQEEIFRGYIDSLFINAPGRADTGLNNLFNNIVSSYRVMLENRHSISSLRNAINLDKKSLSPGAMAMLKAQNELQQKNNRIASLESALKVMAANKITAEPATAVAQDEHTPALKENIAMQENKIATLTAAYYSLKQDNEQLLKQQNDAAKTMSAGELFFKSKAAGLQQKVNTLNAELSLARVDCNISRVDAGQIISNAKQRKELLSEASGILTNLAESDDTDIKKKVREKILRLNQVAANSRD